MGVLKVEDADVLVLFAARPPSSSSVLRGGLLSNASPMPLAWVANVLVLLGAGVGGVDKGSLVIDDGVDGANDGCVANDTDFFFWPLLAGIGRCGADAVAAGVGGGCGGGGEGGLDIVSIVIILCAVG